MKNLLILLFSILTTISFSQESRTAEVKTVDTWAYGGMTIIPKILTPPQGHHWRTNHVLKQVMMDEVVTEPDLIPRYYYAITPKGGKHAIGKFQSDAEPLTRCNTGSQDFVDGFDVILCSDYPIDMSKVRVVWQFEPGFHTRSTGPHEHMTLPPIPSVLPHIMLTNGAANVTLAK